MYDMWIKRDMQTLLQTDAGMLIHIVLGPRQCGKSSLLQYICSQKYTEITLDDLVIRRLAEEDPDFLLAQYQLPIIIDEIQYAPNLFPAIKKYIDNIKRKRLMEKERKHVTTVLFYLTGSNQVLLDKYVKETMVGRAYYFYLNTLSVHEIKSSRPSISIRTILFQGGWPELYNEPLISPVSYLNNYIRQYLEKEIILSVGITKQREFGIFLGMLAGRTGQLLNLSDLAKDSGVSVNTLKEWVSVLERTQLIKLLQPFATNLNKRLTKTPKIYFLDTGLAVRLQGWSEVQPMIQSPLCGGLFETLVFAEIIKYIFNFQKNWHVFLWRTKEQEEIDFLIQTSRDIWIAIDAKLSMGSSTNKHLPASFSKQFPNIDKLILVTMEGEHRALSPTCVQVPIANLAAYLQNF